MSVTAGYLVGAISLIRTLPCLADPGKIIVIGETDAAIDGVLPLLNAILPNVVSYHPFSGVMTLRRRPGLITLYPDKVMITQVVDVAEGLALLAAVGGMRSNPGRKDAVCRGRWTCMSCCRGPIAGCAVRRPAWPSPSVCWRAASRRAHARHWPIRLTLCSSRR